MLSMYYISGGFPVLLWLWHHNKRVWTQVSHLRSLSDKYARERYEPPYPPAFDFKWSTKVDMSLNKETKLLSSTLQDIVTHNIWIITFFACFSVSSVWYLFTSTYKIRKILLAEYKYTIYEISMCKLKYCLP